MISRKSSATLVSLTILEVADSRYFMYVYIYISFVTVPFLLCHIVSSLGFMTVFVLRKNAWLFRCHFASGCCHCLSTLLLLPILTYVKTIKSNLSSLNRVKPLLVVVWSLPLSIQVALRKKKKKTSSFIFRHRKMKGHDEESKPRTGVCCFRTGPPVSTIRAHPIHTSNVCLTV